MRKLLVPALFGMLAVAASPCQEASLLSIVSCSPGEATFSFEQSGVGLFTHTLIQALQGTADTNRNSVVSAVELVEYLARSMRVETDGFQNPWFAFKGHLSAFDFFSSMKGRTTVVLCGIEAYQYLSGTGTGKADVSALQALFARALPGASVKTMVGREVARPALLSLLEQETRALGPGDHLVFYFSGEASEGRLLMHGSRLADAATSGVAVDELARLFAASQAHVCAFFEVQQHVNVPAY